MKRDARVVVGVDGSTNSIAALKWAYEEARLRECTLDVVLASNPTSPTLGGMPPVVVPVSRQDLIDAGYDTLDSAVTTVFPQGTPDDVSTRVVVGSAGTVLKAAAEHAILLVVGARGHGALTGLLLGSTALDCVRHAPCPVVVVPARSAVRVSPLRRLTAVSYP